MVKYSQKYRDRLAIDRQRQREGNRGGERKKIGIDRTTTRRKLRTYAKGHPPSGYFVAVEQS